MIQMKINKDSIDIVKDRLKQSKDTINEIQTNLNNSDKSLTHYKMSLSDKKNLDSYIKISKVLIIEYEDLMRIISKNLNSKNSNKFLTYQKLTTDLRKEKYFSSVEYRICFNPLFSYSKSEIEAAIHKLN